MKAGLISFSILLVLSVFYFTTIHAGTMDRISSDIYKIQDACGKLNLYTVQHTTEENEKYINDLTSRVEKYMGNIKAQMAKLDDTDTIKIPVINYIEKWNVEAIRISLTAEDGMFQSDTGYISSLLPPRKKWKTLFPIFRA